MDHENYVIHYRNLEWLVDLGVEVKKDHKVLSYKQKTWLKYYIEFNIEKRKVAQNNLKGFFKNS